MNGVQWLKRNSRLEEKKLDFVLNLSREEALHIYLQQPTIGHGFALENTKFCTNKKYSIYGNSQDRLNDSRHSDHLWRIISSSVTIQFYNLTHMSFYIFHPGIWYSVRYFEKQDRCIEEVYKYNNDFLFKHDGGVSAVLIWSTDWRVKDS